MASGHVTSEWETIVDDVPTPPFSQWRCQLQNRACISFDIYYAHLLASPRPKCICPPDAAWHPGLTSHTLLWVRWIKDESLSRVKPGAYETVSTRRVCWRRIEEEYANQPAVSRALLISGAYGAQRSVAVANLITLISIIFSKGILLSTGVQMKIDTQIVCHCYEQRELD